MPCSLRRATRRGSSERARDLRVRAGAAATLRRCDVLEDGGVSLLDDLDPLPDVAVCVVGLLGDQAESQRDAAAAERVMRANYIGPALLLGALAERFERRGGGVLVGISSVAGRAGARRELRLRRGQGGVYRIPVRTARPPGRVRRPRSDDQAGLRAHAHDRRNGPAAAADRGAG